MSSAHSAPPRSRSLGLFTFSAAVVLALAVDASISGCSTMKVRAIYDPESTSTLRSYKTYSWLPEPDVQPGTRAPREVVAPIVKRAVDQELQSKGYRLVEGEQADFKIGWAGAVEEKVDLSMYDTTYGYGWGSWYGPYPAPSGGVSPREYEQGTLVLSSVDSATNKLVWRGSAQAELKPNLDGVELEKKIKKAVDKMLDKFPPA